MKWYKILIESFFIKKLWYIINHKITFIQIYLLKFYITSSLTICEWHNLFGYVTFSLYIYIASLALIYLVICIFYKFKVSYIIIFFRWMNAETSPLFKLFNLSFFARGCRSTGTNYIQGPGFINIEKQWIKKTEGNIKHSII